MQNPSLRITIPLWQPLPLRVWRRIVDMAQVARRQRVQRTDRRRDWSALAELNAGTLKDIGAPDWLVLDAAERQGMAHRRLDEFSIWRGV